MAPSYFLIYVFLSITGGFAMFKDINDHFEKLNKENVGSEFHQPLTKWEKIEYFIHWFFAFTFGAALHNVEKLSDLLTTYNDIMLKICKDDPVLNSLHSILITIFICAIPFILLVNKRTAKLLQLKEKND